MQIVRLGHGRNPGEILLRLDAFCRDFVAAQEICVGRYFECSPPEGVACPYEARGLNRHRRRPMIAKRPRRPCRVTAGAVPGVGNLPPGECDWKPLQVLSACG